jgi:hypothetical protein
MGAVLAAAAVYNLAWGALVVLFPSSLFRWAGMAPPNYPAIWQCLGMVVGVYGVGYAIAAANPVRHWPIVLVGLLGKLGGPAGFLYYATRGDLPWIAGWLCVADDLVWWIPFAAIVLHAWCIPPRDPSPLTLPEALHQARTADGLTLAELSRGRRLLVVFLRHFG